MKMANLALAFLLELAMLAAFAYWGFHQGRSLPIRLLLGVGTPVAVAVLWGLFMAPHAIIPISNELYFVVNIVLFGLAAIALYVAGRPILSVIFGSLIALNRILIHIWHQ